MKLFHSTPSKKNFTADMMPKNRREVFFDVFKLQWKSLLFCGLIILLFSIPLHFVSVYEYLTVVSLRDMQAAVSSDTARAEFDSQITLVSLTSSLISIPALMFLSIGISGIMRVIRQYAWEDVVYFKTDFTIGIKQNLKQTLLLSFLVGLGNFIVEVNAVFAGASDDMFKTALVLVPAALIILFGIPTAAYVSALIPIYGNRFSTNLKIGFGLSAKHPVKTFLALIISAIPFALSFIPVFICNIIGIFVGSFVSPFVMLGFFLHSYNIFDVEINKGEYAHLKGRGTFCNNAEE